MSKKEGKSPVMNMKLFEYIAQIVKNITDLCNKTVDAADSEKHATAIKLLVDDNFATMRKLVEQDETLNISEKLEKLNQIAKCQQKSQLIQAEEFKNNREHVKKIVIELFVAFITCGLSHYIPKIISECKKASIDMPEDALIESQISIDRVEEADRQVEELTTV